MKFKIFELPEIDRRTKWQIPMRILQLNVLNDYHFALFQVIRAVIITLFCVWVTLIVPLLTGDEEFSSLIRVHFLKFWMISATIINFIVLPYQILKAKRMWGFNTCDYLEIWRVRGGRHLWNRSRIIRGMSFVCFSGFLGLQIGWIWSSLIFDRYEVNSLFGYVILSLLAVVILTGAAASLYGSALSLIQYIFFFPEIPNEKLQQLNLKGETHVL